ncbi:MAG: hypothetical protein NTZ84_00645 [Candidatus Nealsonbacteria bacterium]|nr:hypothetical protein [Candidatus Nealsonbacteria bacterium]
MVALGGARAKARDARRTSDIRQVVSAQEMYYGTGSTDLYMTTGTVGTLYFGTPAIGTYLPAAHDPQVSGTLDYKWVGNAGPTTCSPVNQSGTWFCAYALLEETPVGTVYFVASQNGSKKITGSAPTGACPSTCF